MTRDVARWLEKIGLGKYTEVFAQNDIDSRALPELTEQDLKELGVSLGHRRILLNAIAEFGELPANAIKLDVLEETSTEDDAERRQLSVMFCDLVGSTELSQRLDLEDLREINHVYQDACARAIERYGGFVARYMGDGVLAYFGYPQAHEDDAERAVYAGLGVIEAMDGIKVNQQNVRLSVRVGIATGPVVVGDLVGTGASQENTAVGETPNLAARLQGLAEPNSLVIADSTHRLVGKVFDCAKLGTHELKGFSLPQVVWRVNGTRQVLSRFEATRRAALTPFVGREEELEIISRRWTMAKRGEGQVVLLSGEPGIGKSRLTQAFLASIADGDPTVLRYQCSSHHTNSALHPIVVQLEHAAKVQPDDSPEIRFKKLDGILLGATERNLPTFATLLSIPPKGLYQPIESAPEKLKQQTLDALIEELKQLCKRGSVIVLFEDLHWIDHTSRELVDFIVDEAQNLPLLTILTFRQEYVAPWVGHAHVTLLAFSRLPNQACTNIVTSITHGKPLPDTLLGQIIIKADGIPLFVEELTQAVLESGIVEEMDDKYVLSGPIDSLAVPDTLQESLTARLDQLDSVREVAQTAAAIGREFSGKLLGATLTRSSGDLNEALSRLIRSGLVIQRGSDSFVFKHALVQDAAYDSLLKTRRAALHERIANTLSELFPDTTENEPEVLAYHYAEAGLTELALEYWFRAGKRAAQHGANVESIAHLRQGLMVLANLPEGEERTSKEIELRIALGVPLASVEGVTSAVVKENYEKAQTLCEKSEQTDKLFPVLWGQWIRHMFLGEVRSMGPLADRLLEVASEQNDTSLQLEAHHCQWSSHFLVGEFSVSLEHTQHGINLYKPEEHHALTFIYGGHDPGVCARNVSALALWLLGYPEQAQNRFSEAFQLCRELEHGGTLADTFQMAMELSALEKDVTVLQQQAEELADLAATERLYDYKTLVDGTTGWLMFNRGDSANGLSLMRQAANSWLSQRMTWSVPSMLLVVDGLAQAGEIDEGLKLLDAAFSFAKNNDVRWLQPELYRIRGEFLQLQTPGNPSAAEDLLLKSLGLARELDAKSLELRTATNLAQLWYDQGKHTEASELLAPVVSWFTEGLDETDLNSARALLEQLE